MRVDAERNLEVVLTTSEALDAGLGRGTRSTGVGHVQCHC
jgi:hypothetical protein